MNLCMSGGVHIILPSCYSLCCMTISNGRSRYTSQTEGSAASLIIRKSLLELHAMCHVSAMSCRNVFMMLVYFYEILFYDFIEEI